MIEKAKHRVRLLVSRVVILGLAALPLVLAACQNGNTGGGGY